MDYPLEGIRVVDFTQYQQGTVSTLMLADWGADVIKVEPQGIGDPGRTLGPRGPKGLGSGYFEANNRNKRSIVVDVNPLPIARRWSGCITIVVCVTSERVVFQRSEDDGIRRSANRFQSAIDN